MQVAPNKRGLFHGEGVRTCKSEVVHIAIVGAR